MHYDLILAHRVSPSLSKEMIGFSDKHSMVESCTESIKCALAPLRTKMIVILDGCSADYERIFTSRFQHSNLEIIRNEPAIGNHATFAQQTKLLGENMKSGDAVYYSEDDYYYVPEAFQRMIEFLHAPGVDFISPLDHPESYRLHTVTNPYISRLRVSAHRHWRQIPTTCCTFMASASTFAKAQKNLSYGSGADDGTMWLGLTKGHVFNPFALARAAIACTGATKQWDMSPFCAWKHNWKTILFHRRFRLWSPIPTLAVHLSSTSLPLFSDQILGNCVSSEKIRKQMLHYLELDQNSDNRQPV